MAASSVVTEAPTGSSSDYGVPGFDIDLLDDKTIAGHLGTLGRATMVGALQRGLVAVRVNALAALHQHGALGLAEIPTIAVMLKVESPSVRAAAARALAAAVDPAAAIGALCDATDDHHDRVRQEVAAAIAGFGKAALPALIARLRCSAEDADRLVLPHLRAMGEVAAEPLVSAFAHDDERVRANAVAGLAGLGPAALIRHQDELRLLQEDPSEMVRALVREAMNAVYRHTHSSHLPPAPPPVEHFTTQPLAEAEVAKLARIRPETLQHFARDGRAVARLNAWRCLGRLDKLDDYTTALGLVALKDHDPRVRATACTVVTSCADDRLSDVVEGLVRRTLDREVTVRDAAVAALDDLGKRSLPVLVELLGERDQDVAGKLVEAVARHGHRAAKPLYATLDQVGPIQRWNALLALIAIGGKTLEGAFDKLVELLKEPFDAARAVVVRALGRLPGRTKGHADVVAVIEYMLEYDASLAVRGEADIALRRIAAAKARE